jgi:hypothetical protein
LFRGRVAAPDAEIISNRLDLPKQLVTLEWSGFWFVRRGCTCDVQIRADAEASLSIDGNLVLHREEDQHEARIRSRVSLGPGPHAIRLTYTQGRNPPFLVVSWAPEGEPLRHLAPTTLFLEPATAWQAFLSVWLDRLGSLMALLAVASLVVALIAWGREETGQRALAVLVPVLLMAYGAALRFEFLTGRTWTEGAPALAVRLAQGVAHLHPHWFVDRPRVPYDGDPWTYIRFGRSMVGFYDASVREPVFVFGTKLFLHLLDGQNVAVGFASATFSVLLILATYLLGREAFGVWVGSLAALGIAVERNVVQLSVDGWRDDAFAFFVVLSAYALVRMERAPTFQNGVLAGLAGAGACLTRITALSFLVPVWALFLALLPLRSFKERLGRVGLAAGTTLYCVAPFLLTCTIVFHDPLYSINFHTGYYRGAEFLPVDQPTGVFEYLKGRGAGRPLEMVDTALMGLTAIPFDQRWTGFDYWAPGLGLALSGLSLAGLLLFCFHPLGRLVILVLLTSLVPFAFTWNIAGGGGWRFRLCAYPFYLVGSAFALVEGCRLAARFVRGEIPRPDRSLLWKGVAVLAGAVVVWGGLLGLAYLRVREEVRNGASLVVLGAPRNRLLVGSGWSEPVDLGNVPVRLCGGQCLLDFPLQGGTDYVLLLRADPLPREPGSRQSVHVSLNGRSVADLTLVAGDGRIGTYSVRLPASGVKDGRNEVALEARSPAWIDASVFGGRGERKAGFALWLVNLSRG